MKKGTIWRLGDGVGLNIWYDPWIPRDFSRQVAELIDPYTGSWDVTLVWDCFWEEDAKLILALPVHQGHDNTLAWHFDKHRVFSVKSAYKVG